MGGLLSLATVALIPLAAKAASSMVGIEYSRPAGVPLYMDASIPEGPGPFPAVIIVHGGGWVRGDRRVDVAPLFKPLEQAGIAWFSIDYRLLRNLIEFGAPIDDVQNAVLFVKSHAAEYNIDPERIVLIGESAGGQLAAMAALKPVAGASVQGVVAFYSPTDLESLAKNSAMIPEELHRTLRGTPFEAMLFVFLRQLSPVANIPVGSSGTAPPFLFIHGTRDQLVPFAQSETMCGLLKSAGSTCELYPVEGAGHGMRWWESSAYQSVMIRWLRQQLVMPKG